MLSKCIIAFSALLLTSCASILSKSTYPVTFDTNPSGANIVISDTRGLTMYKGNAPTTLSLPASSGFFSGARYTVEATMPGYAPASGTLVAGLDGWYIGNILFGGLIGLLLVDPATGAMFKLDDRLVINMQQAVAATALLP